MFLDLCGGEGGGAGIEKGRHFRASMLAAEVACRLYNRSASLLAVEVACSKRLN